MSYGKALRLLCSQLWRWDRKGVILVFVLSLYVGASMSFNVNAMFGEDEIPSAIIGITDWMFLALLPVLGTCMNRTIFGIWRDDSYTRRMAFLRAHPIPLSVIIGSRIAQSVASVTINVTALLAVMYALSPDLRDHVSGSRWIAFGVIWICYGLIGNMAMIWLELGHSGKRYVLFYLIGLGILTGIDIALSWLDVHPFREVLDWTKMDGVLAIVLCAIGLAAMALWLGYRAATRKIRTRSIAF